MSALSELQEPVRVEVRRNGVVESVHRVAVVALAPGGEPVLARGAVSRTFFPRSSNKPMQAAGMVRAGLDLDGERLAVAASSHNGEDLHLALVRSVLASVGLDVAALGNTPDLPLHPPSARKVVAAGGGPAPLYQNCSGKHAAMLATCVINDWPTDTYLDPVHPLQVRLAQTVADLTGVTVGQPAVDGCGAPLWGLPLKAVAAAFGRLASAPVGTAGRRVADAMRAHPYAVGGADRDVTRLMQAVPGLLAKDGAEGFYAAGLPDGTGVALKVEDGAARARAPVMVAVLRRLGLAGDGLADIGVVPVLGHGRAVGELRAVL